MMTHKSNKASFKMSAVFCPRDIRSRHPSGRTAQYEFLPGWHGNVDAVLLLLVGPAWRTV